MADLLRDQYIAALERSFQAVSDLDSTRKEVSEGSKTEDDINTVNELVEQCQEEQHRIKEELDTAIANLTLSHNAVKTEPSQYQNLQQSTSNSSTGNVSEHEHQSNTASSSSSSNVDTAGTVNVANNSSSSDHINPVAALRPPKPSSYKHGEDFRAFSRNFTDYCMLTIGTTKKEGIFLTLHAFVDERTKIFLRDVDLTPTEKLDAELFLPKYILALHPEDEMIGLKRKMRLLKQGHDETVVDFADRIRTLSKRAYGDGYSDVREENRKTVLIEGVRDLMVQRDLYDKEARSTFETLVSQARHVEGIESQLRSRRQPQTTQLGHYQENVHRIHPSRQVTEPQRGRGAERYEKESGSWLDKAECWHCHEIGHIRWYCPQLKRKNSLNYRQAGEMMTKQDDHGLGHTSRKE